jgi:hypothetical protein
LLSEGSHEKFMREIQKQIDDTDKDAKQKAENILHAITDHYNAAIVERVAYELQMAESETKLGNLSVAEWHKLMAELYQSVLGATKLGG